MQFWVNPHPLQDCGRIFPKQRMCSLTICMNACIKQKLKIIAHQLQVASSNYFAEVCTNSKLLALFYFLIVPDSAVFPLLAIIGSEGGI